MRLDVSVVGSVSKADSIGTRYNEADAARRIRRNWSPDSRLAARCRRRCLSRFPGARIRRVRRLLRRRPRRQLRNACAGRTGSSGSGRRRTDRGDARISSLSERAVHRVVRRRTRTALLPVRQRAAVCGAREVLPERAEEQGHARVRRARHARVRDRPIPRRDDGVSAGRDDQGLHVERQRRISESETEREARALSVDHSDRPGAARRAAATARPASRRKSLSSS